VSASSFPLALVPLIERKLLLLARAGAHLFSLEQMPRLFYLQRLGFVPEFNIMKKEYITTNSRQTQRLGELLAEELRGGGVICLTGELGSGKTTFAQGMLKGLGAKGPHTSPTFVVVKHYKKKYPISNIPACAEASAGRQYPNKSQTTKSKNQKKYQIPDTKYQIQNIYHIDCYRVEPKGILDLGWNEIIAGKSNIVIVEWAEKVKRIVPKGAVWVKFEHIKGDKRKINVKAKSEKLKCKSKN
jgi:tRNA threonylcarbamoyladenosine biosynthesis protein TsaE